MADRWAVANGNWSSTATWNGGTLPTAADDVFADGFTVTIDQNVTVLSIRTTQRSGGTTGGGFTLNGGVAVTGNIIYGTTTCITANYSSPATSTIIGNINAIGSQNREGVSFGGTGTLVVIGNISGGQSNAMIAIVVNSTGRLEVTGNVFQSVGGQAGGDAIRINANATVIITGNVSSTSVAAAIGTNASCFITVTGNVTCTSSASAIAIQPYTGGAGNPRCTIVGAIYGSSGASAISHTGMTVIHDGILGANSSGRMTVSVPFYLIHATNSQQHTYRVNNGGSPGVERSLFTGGQNLGQPTVANVRAGTAFGVSNEFTGTLIVPSAQFVSLGTPVDSGVGTLQYLTMADLQSALAPNAPTTVERSKDDTNGITFSWPVSGATITGQVSKNNGAYAATAGAVSFLRTDGTRYYYTLAYNAADRPPAEGTARYRLTDGTYTKYFTLRVEPSYVANVSVTPGFALQQDPATKQDLLIYTDEEDNFTVDIFRQDGFTPVNLSGMNLQFKVSDLNDQLLYTIGSGNITIGGADNNQITFPKASLTSNDFEGKWGLRDAANGDKVIAYGRIEILYVP